MHVALTYFSRTMAAGKWVVIDQIAKLGSPESSLAV